MTSQERRGGERLIERPWLQLMCCVLVSGREVSGIPYWVRKSKMYLEFVHKEVPGGEPELRIAEVFLL